MNTRRAYVDLIYNGTAATAEISGFVTDISYTDPASGEADSLDITLQDRDRRWTGAWIPVAGDTLAATIRALNCQYSGDNRILPCGFFIVDSFSFSGWPVSGSISAISTPLDSSFTTTQRTKTWENVTIKEIGTEIAGRAGIALAWDVKGTPFTIKSVEQSEQTDCEFYMNLCNTYGLAMKVYAQKIVVYDREAYKKKGAAAVLSPSSMKSWSWQQDQAGTYTGGEFTYTSPATEKEIKVTVGKGSRILKQSGKADSKADAERKIKAAVAKANHGKTKLSATIVGNASLVASQCVRVVGLGKLSGKYYIDTITHNVSGSGGYTMDLEMSLVEE